MRCQIGSGFYPQPHTCSLCFRMPCWLAELPLQFIKLESVAGWKTARTNRPVLILGSLDGIETGVRQLIRDEPLQTMTVEFKGEKIVLPTDEEMLRIKAVLILKRNATRDYLDFVALSDHMGDKATMLALSRFDYLYPQENGESALQQLQIQLANPMPYDLEETRLSEYKNLNPQWHDWSKITKKCSTISMLTFDAICGQKPIKRSG